MVECVSSLTEIGGTVYNNDIEIGFIQGIDDKLTTQMTPDTMTLYEKPTGAAVAIPIAINILSVTTIDDIDAFTDGTATYKPHNFIPLTPFLCKEVSEGITKNQGDYKTLLLTVMLAIKKFDAEFDGNDDYTNKARQKCKDILYWLYLVGKEDSPIKAIPTTVCTSRRVQERLNGITSQCLGQTKDKIIEPRSTELADALGTHLKRPLEIIVTSNSTQSNILHSFQAQHEKANEKSSRSFTRLPAQYQNMMLVALSQGEVTTMDINDNAKAFFKCTNHLSANVI